MTNLGFILLESLADCPRNNVEYCLISKTGILAINNALLKDPFLITRRIKANLELIAKTRTISRYINRLGWRKVNTKYCQIFTPINRVKRVIYACLAKLNNEQFKECFDIDATTVELRHNGQNRQTKTSFQNSFIWRNFSLRPKAISNVHWYYVKQRFPELSTL